MILSKSKIYEMRLIKDDLIDKDLIKDWGLGISLAVTGGCEKLVYFFISKEADCWEEADC